MPGTYNSPNHAQLSTTFAGFVLLAFFNCLLILVFGTAPLLARGNLNSGTTATAVSARGVTTENRTAAPMATGQAAPLTTGAPLAGGAGTTVV